MQGLREKQFPRGVKSPLAAVQVMEHGCGVHLKGVSNLLGKLIAVTPCGKAGSVWPEIMAGSIQLDIIERSGVMACSGQCVQ